MGRPIKKKFFGSDNVNDGLTYTGPGGESVSSITYTNRGSNYSQGLTATTADSPIGGTSAVITIAAVSTANGRIDTATVSTAGTGYTTAPAITLVKPANVNVTGQNISFWQDSANLRLSSTTGLFVGMFSNVAGAGTSMITNIYTDGNIRANVTYGNVTSATPIRFYDAGASGSLTAVLAATTVTANTIQANAWITGGTIGKQADIVSQRSSRRYKVTNADGTDTCRLVPASVSDSVSGNTLEDWVAAVTAAKGPIRAGEMTLEASDSTGGTYWVGKLESRTCLVFPGGTGTPGTQFAANTHVIWTSTGSAVLNTGTATAPSSLASVKIGTND